MAYSWCRFTIARDTLERYAGALRIYAKTQLESAHEANDHADALDMVTEASFANGASTALRTIVGMDGEVDPDTFAAMVMSAWGGGE